MLVVFYYRTKQPEILQAHASDEMAVARIEATAERFAKQFNARPYFTVGFDSHFCGIGFDKDHPCMFPSLWTPRTDTDPRQVPRSPERAGEKMRAEAERVYELYHDSYPKEESQPRESALLTVLRLSERTDMERQLLVYHEYQGEAFIASSLPLAIQTEIIASEFVNIQRVIQGANNG